MEQNLSQCSNSRAKESDHQCSSETKIANPQKIESITQNFLKNLKRYSESKKAPNAEQEMREIAIESQTVTPK